MNIKKCILSVCWNVNVARRSYWVPFDVTVKFKVTAAHEPGSPQSVGGLSLPSEPRFLNDWVDSRILHNLRAVAIVRPSGSHFSW